MKTSKNIKNANQELLVKYGGLEHAFIDTPSEIPNMAVKESRAKDENIMDKEHRCL